MKNNDKEKRRLQKEWENAAKNRDTLTMRRVQEEVRKLISQEEVPDA